MLLPRPGVRQDSTWSSSTLRTITFCWCLYFPYKKLCSGVLEKLLLAHCRESCVYRWSWQMNWWRKPNLDARWCYFRFDVWPDNVLLLSLVNIIMGSHLHLFCPSFVQVVPDETPSWPRGRALVSMNCGRCYWRKVKRMSIYPRHSRRPPLCTVRSQQRNWIPWASPLGSASKSMGYTTWVGQHGVPGLVVQQGCQDSVDEGQGGKEARRNVQRCKSRMLQKKTRSLVYAPYQGGHLRTGWK